LKNLKLYGLIITVLSGVIFAMVYSLVIPGGSFSNGRSVGVNPVVLFSAQNQNPSLSPSVETLNPRELAFYRIAQANSMLGDFDGAKNVALTMSVESGRDAILIMIADSFLAKTENLPADSDGKANREALSKSDKIINDIINLSDNCNLDSSKVLIISRAARYKAGLEQMGSTVKPTSKELFDKSLSIAKTIPVDQGGAFASVEKKFILAAITVILGIIGYLIVKLVESICEEFAKSLAKEFEPYTARFADRIKLALDDRMHRDPITLPVSDKEKEHK
jgi:hypothetical protein